MLRLEIPGKWYHYHRYHHYHREHDIICRVKTWYKDQEQDSPEDITFHFALCGRKLVKDLGWHWHWHWGWECGDDERWSSSHLPGLWTGTGHKCWELSLSRWYLRCISSLHTGSWPEPAPLSAPVRDISLAAASDAGAARHSHSPPPCWCRSGGGGAHWPHLYTPVQPVSQYGART